MRNFHINPPLPGNFVEVFVSKGWRGIENIFGKNKHQATKMIIKAGGYDLVKQLRDENLRHQRKAAVHPCGAGSRQNPERIKR